MITGYKYFMEVAKEKSISRAAGKLYITQQSLSEQMQKLEQMHHAKLFQRSPRFQLTPAGEALLETLEQIRILEEGLDTRLAEIQEKQIGRLCVGIHLARARTFLPETVRAFSDVCPNVRLTFYHGDTVRFEKMLLAGDLDLFLGVNTEERPEFIQIPLAEEAVWFVASNDFIRKWFHCEPSALQSIPPERFQNIPVIVSPPFSHFQQNIDLFFEAHNIILNRYIEAADFGIQLRLAQQSVGACFCPQQFLQGVTELNSIDTESRLHFFPVSYIPNVSRLSLVIHSRAYRSGYLNEFIRIMQEEFLKSFKGR